MYRFTMQSADDQIQDYLAALRILELEGPNVLGPKITVAYRRLLLQRIADLDSRSRSPARSHIGKPTNKSLPLT